MHEAELALFLEGGSEVCVCVCAKHKKGVFLQVFNEGVCAYGE